MKTIKKKIEEQVEEPFKPPQITYIKSLDRICAVTKECATKTIRQSDRVFLYQEYFSSDVKCVGFHIQKVREFSMEHSLPIHGSVNILTTLTLLALYESEGGKKAIDEHVIPLIKNHDLHIVKFS